MCYQNDEIFLTWNRKKKSNRKFYCFKFRLGQMKKMNLVENDSVFFFVCVVQIIIKRIFSKVKIWFDFCLVKWPYLNGNCTLCMKTVVGFNVIYNVLLVMLIWNFVKIIQIHICVIIHERCEKNMKQKMNYIVITLEITMKFELGLGLW